jgi:hypothetical protein
MNERREAVLVTYKPNTPISLAETQIVFYVNGHLVEMPAKAVLNLLPKPILRIECEDNLTNEYLHLVHFNDKSITASIYEQETEFIIGHSSVRWSRIQGDSRISLSLVPKREPISIHRTDGELSSVEFGVLNFPNFLGKQDKSVEKEGKSRRLGAVQLKADHWVIDVTAEFNLSEMEKELKSTGGYAVTHKGTAMRSDGSSFTVQEVEPLLDALQLFLSFARGAFCGLTLVAAKVRMAN